MKDTSVQTKHIRQTCWFPGMRKQVQDFVASCHPGNAAQPHTHTQPCHLRRYFLPDQPWQKVHVCANFKRPIGENTPYTLLSTIILNS